MDGGDESTGSASALPIDQTDISAVSVGPASSGKQVEASKELEMMNKAQKNVASIAAVCIAEVLVMLALVCAQAARLLPPRQIFWNFLAAQYILAYHSAFVLLVSVTAFIAGICAKRAEDKEKVAKWVMVVVGCAIGFAIPTGICLFDIEDNAARWNLPGFVEASYIWSVGVVGLICGVSLAYQARVGLAYAFCSRARSAQAIALPLTEADAKDAPTVSPIRVAVAESDERLAEKYNPAVFAANVFASYLMLVTPGLVRVWAFLPIFTFTQEANERMFDTQDPRKFRISSLLGWSQALVVIFYVVSDVVRAEWGLALEQNGAHEEHNILALLPSRTIKDALSVSTTGGIVIGLLFWSCVMSNPLWRHVDRVKMQDQK